MGFFDEDDPFEDILRGFFGERRPSEKARERFISDDEEDRKIDFTEDTENIYLIFELPGFSSKDILINIKGKEIEIRAQKKESINVQKYLREKLNTGVLIRKTLPSIVNPKKMEYSIKNGILEVKLGKK